MNIEKSHVSDHLPKHPDHFTKGDVGRTLVVAGTKGMVGSSVFASGGALRSGSGMVYLLTDDTIQQTVQTWFPEVVCIDFNTSKEFLERYDALVIGPGLGRGVNAVRLVEFFLENFKKTVVVDADGLNVVSENPHLQELLKSRRSKGYMTIITPHFKEAKRLMGISTAVDKDRKIARFGHDVYRRSLAKQLRDKYDSIVVMKGAGTLVYFGDDFFVNTTGNVGMATAGSGDVLAGIIASFAAQGIDALESAICGVYVHGLAGDKAAEEKGTHGILARDIVNYVPYAINALR